MLLNSVLLAVPSLLVIGTSYFAVRSYLRTAPKGYITEGATYSRINTTLTETVEGARTVEALGLSGRRVAPGRRRHRGLGAGRALHDVAAQPALRRHRRRLQHPARGHPGGRRLGLRAGLASTLGQITAAVLYVEALSGPLDRLVGELDRLQVGATSTARLLGIAEVPPDRDARRRAARRRRAGRRGPALRLPRGPRRAARHRPRAAHRRAAGHRRPVRLGQVDPRPAALRHQPAAHRLGRGRRRRPGRPAAGGAAHRGRAGHPGAPRLHRLGARQHRARPRGLPRRGGLGRAARGRLRRLGARGCRAASTPGSAPASRR